MSLRFIANFASIAVFFLYVVFKILVPSYLVLNISNNFHFELHFCGIFKQFWSLGLHEISNGQHIATVEKVLYV